MSNTQYSSVVTPAERDLRFRKKDDFEMWVDLGRASVSRQPVDVLLLFDRTASMGNVIREAQKNANAIMREVHALYPNTSFGVAALADYGNGEQPWMLYLDITSKSKAVGRALQTIALADGVDYPEAYARAIFESRYIGWRPGARKYVILFGDAPAHDPVFYGTDLGIDPGRDALVGTSDDLRLETVVADLARDSITVLAIYDDTRRKPLRDETRKGFDFMARHTGGVSVPISSASEVVEVVEQSLRRVLQPAPSLGTPATYATWVKNATFSRETQSENRFSAPIKISAPPGTRAGIHTFPVSAIRTHSAGADTLGSTWVTVRVGILNYPWRLPLLLVFFASLFGLLLRHIHVATRRFVRYEHNSPILGLFARLAVLGLVVLTALLIWKYAPGSVPPNPNTPEIAGP